MKCHGAVVASHNVVGRSSSRAVVCAGVEQVAFTLKWALVLRRWGLVHAVRRMLPGKRALTPPRRGGAGELDLG